MHRVSDFAKLLNEFQDTPDSYRDCLGWAGGKDCCDLLCAWRYTEILRFCYHLASAKQVTLFFEVKSGKGDLLCAKQVALSSRVTTFQTLLTLRGQDSESNDLYLGRVRPALRKAGRTLAIGL